MDQTVPSLPLRKRPWDWPIVVFFSINILFVTYMGKPSIQLGEQFFFPRSWAVSLMSRLTRGLLDTFQRGWDPGSGTTKRDMLEQQKRT